MPNLAKDYDDLTPEELEEITRSGIERRRKLSVATKRRWDEARESGADQVWRENISAAMKKAHERRRNATPYKEVLS